MKLHLFSIYDSKAEAFIQPFFSPNQAVAQRSFSIACSDPEHAFHIHPGDYTLFSLGTFEHDDASFAIYPTPINLGLAITFIRDDPPGGGIDCQPDLPTQITQTFDRKESK